MSSSSLGWASVDRQEPRLERLEEVATLSHHSVAYILKVCVSMSYSVLTKIKFRLGFWLFFCFELFTLFLGELEG